jgi:hypothetical protein
LEKIVFGTELGEKEIEVHILQSKNVVLHDKRRTFHKLSRHPLMVSLWA